MYGSRGLMPFSRGLGVGTGFARTGINWLGFLNGTQRTLGLVNQVIPLINQARPFYNNMRTMFRIAQAFKDRPKNSDSNTSNTSSDSNIITNNNDKIVENKSEASTASQVKYENKPTFFQ